MAQVLGNFIHYQLSSMLGEQPKAYQPFIWYGFQGSEISKATRFIYNWLH